MINDITRLLEARHHDPFCVLGKHSEGDGEIIRAYLPGAIRATVGANQTPMQRVNKTDLFEWRGSPGDVSAPYELTWHDSQQRAHTGYDPYCFGPQISDFDLHLFGEGRHWHAYRVLGAHIHQVEGIRGVRFATWAPNAERVSVVGDFNRWDGRWHPMRVRGGTGVWELFIPGVEAGALYKFEIRNRDTGYVFLKADPYARHFQMRPSTASIVCCESVFDWQDEEWLLARKHRDWLHAPLSIYEVHLGSWRRAEDGGFLNYRELADQLVPYVTDLGFTHIELLPVTEHPLDASWGYQTIGYFAPTSRFGNPDDFRYFVDQCHRHGIGVLLDWAPAHFPKDPHGLARFDGTATYEHEDPRRGEHRDWGTLIFNYGRHEVKDFLISSAICWLEEFHIDGLRVDAVASMLYLDYSRAEGDWVPNEYGGRENLEAIAFLRELNEISHQLHPGTLMTAEESTDWPMVSRPTWMGGLGFGMKWNMGWMHDTLQYIEKDPIFRKYHHDNLTFGQIYAYHENFILPFSHDEVVHGKRSMRYKMPGDEPQQFANLRLLYTYLFTMPGKKLLFMGSEFGQGPEWNFNSPLDWYVLEYPLHQGLLRLVRDLAHLCQSSGALHRYDFEPRGFDWIDCHDWEQSTLSYVRMGDGETLIIVLNFTPVQRDAYRIGVPHPGSYQEIFNSDSAFYGGGNIGNGGGLNADPTPWMNRPYSIALTLPPLSGIILKPDSQR